VNQPLPPIPTVPTGRLWWLWVIAAGAFGLGMRMLVGMLPVSTNGAMSMGFLVGTPLAIGAITVMGAPMRPPHWVYCVFAPWISVAFGLVLCFAAQMEGTICLAIIAPLFFSVASLGGVVSGVIMRRVRGLPMSSVAALPLVLLFMEQFMPLQAQELEVRRSVEVAAPASVVWKQILDAKAIRPEEIPFSLTHAMGVPRPVEGVNVRTPEGEVRYSKWERGVHFSAAVAEREENRSIHWLYHFDPDSFPAGTMDEHVAIGGRYFGLRDTTFNLQPSPGGGTRLEIVAHYTVASTVNFYAVPVSRLLGRDFVDSILGLYKGRSERAVGVTR
jgi:hypothetical protein